MAGSFRGPIALSSAAPEAAAHLAALPHEVAAVDAAVLRQPADLVVLRRVSGGDGRGADGHGGAGRLPGGARLEAELLAVAFPSGWSPSSRLGASLTTLHAPVAGNDRLQRAAPALAEALLTKGPFEQHVWGVQDDASLAHDPAYPVEPDPSGRWWLRVERQTTLPLPRLERALFFIRPTLTPLAALSGEQLDVLAAAVRSMTQESLRYKGLSGARGVALLDEIRRLRSRGQPSRRTATS